MSAYFLRPSHNPLHICFSTSSCLVFHGTGLTTVQMLMSPTAYPCKSFSTVFLPHILCWHLSWPLCSPLTPLPWGSRPPLPCKRSQRVKTASPLLLTRNHGAQFPAAPDIPITPCLRTRHSGFSPTSQCPLLGVPDDSTSTFSTWEFCSGPHSWPPSLLYGHYLCGTFSPHLTQSSSHTLLKVSI